MNNIEHIIDGIDALRVPPFDFSTVRARAARGAKRPRRLIAAGMLALLVPAMAAAAVRYWPAHIVESPGGRTEIYSSAKDVKFSRPFTTAWEREVAERAPYRVIWPSGLPAGTRPANGLSFAYGAFFLSYKCAERRGFLQFVIAPAASAPAQRSTHKMPMQMMLTFRNHYYDWIAGGEHVRLQTNCLTADEIARVRTAMIAEARAGQ